MGYFMNELPLSWTVKYSICALGLSAHCRVSLVQGTNVTQQQTNADIDTWTIVQWYTKTALSRE